MAVKIFDAMPEDEQGELLRRLARVSRRAACVRHPSVIQTLEIDRTSGSRAAQTFIVTELVCGESLASLLAAW